MSRTVRMVQRVEFGVIGNVLATLRMLSVVPFAFGRRLPMAEAEEEGARRLEAGVGGAADQPPAGGRIATLETPFQVQQTQVELGAGVVLRRRLRVTRRRLPGSP